MVVAGEEKFDGGEEEEAAEDIGDPGESVNQDRTGQNHHPSHHQCAQDPPEENTVLIFLGNAKVREDQGDDENVVEAEGLFDQPPGEELQRRLLAGELLSVGCRNVEDVVIVDIVRDATEKKRKNSAKTGPNQRLSGPNHPVFAVKEAEVQRKHDHHKNQEANPKPDRRHLVTSLFGELSPKPRPLEQRGRKFRAL